MSVHFPLSHGDVAADVAAMLLGGSVIPLGGESVVDSRHVVVQSSDVSELLGGLAFSLANLADPVTLLQVDPHDMSFDPEDFFGFEGALSVHAQPGRSVVGLLEVSSALLSEKMGRLVR